MIEFDRPTRPPTQVMARPKSDTRERLLTATMEHVAAYGVGDFSLRALAPALGTSHRMLIYHFGSREGLLVEVVRSFDQRNRQLAAEITADESASPVEQIRRIWRSLTDPELAAYQRLFVELYGKGLQGHPQMEGLPAEIQASWATPVAHVFRDAGVGLKDSRELARLTIAVVLGLVMDRLATDKPGATDRAMNRYLAYLDSEIARAQPVDGAHAPA